MMTNRENNYQPYIDFLRLIAAFFVIFIHSEAAGLFEIASDGPLHTFIYIISTVFVRMAVPVFFMISGALMLGKDESWGKIFKVRIWRIAVVLFFANMVMYLVILLKENNMQYFNLIYFLEATLDRGFTLAYWFLYAYIGFLIILPFLRGMVKHIEKNEIIVLISIVVITNFVIPYYQYVSNAVGVKPFNLNGYFGFGAITDTVIFYPIAGYYLHNKLDLGKIKPLHILICFIIMVGSTLATVVLVWHQGIRNGFSAEYISMNVSLTALIFFIIVRWMFERISVIKNNMRFIKFLKFVGPLTLGIYIIDPIFLLFRDDIFAKTDMHIFYFSLLWCVSSMILGGAITYILRKVSIIKKYL